MSTADSPTRGQGTGTWEILSAEGKAVGANVVSGDLVYLRNLYGGDGGYLDTNGYATTDQKNGGGKYNVLTSKTRTAPPVPAAGVSSSRRPAPVTSMSGRAT